MRRQPLDGPGDVADFIRKEVDLLERRAVVGFGGHCREEQARQIGGCMSIEPEHVPAAVGGFASVVSPNTSRMATVVVSKMVQPSIAIGTRNQSSL